MIDLDLVERYTRTDRTGPDLLRGAVAGAAGGFVGSLRMAMLAQGWQTLNRSLEDADPEWAKPLTEDRGEGDDDPLPPRGDRTQAKAVRDTTAAAVETVQDGPATRTQKDVGGIIVHQATGVVAGAVYGAAAELLPVLGKAHGLPLGVGTYLLGRNVGMTAAGLAPRPTRQSKRDQAFAAVSHLAFGFVAELVRKRLRRALEPS